MKKQGFLKGSAILVGMVVITKGLGLVYKVPLANILGGTGMGYFSAAFSMFTPIFALAVSGIPSAMARLAAENAALGRYADLRRQRRVAMTVYSLTGLAACGCVMLPALLGAAGAEVRWALICLAPSVVFCSIMNVERGYHEGLGNMLPTALSEIAETVFKLILGLGLALYVQRYAADSFAACGKVFGAACRDISQAQQAALPFVAAGAVLGSTLASGIACAGLLTVMRIKGDGVTKTMLAADPVTESRRRHARTLLGLSGSIAMAAVVTTLTGMLDMLTVSPCLRAAMERAPQDFTQYDSIAKNELPNFLYGSYEGLAVMLYGLVPTLTAMLGKSALAPLTDSIARGDKNAAGGYLRRLLMLSAGAAIPCGLGITVLSGEILSALFGTRQLECLAAQAPLAILGLSVIFFGMALPCFTVIQALGRPSKVTVMMLISGVIKLLLNLALIPFWGLNGAAAAELISCVYVCAASLRETVRLSGCRVSLTKTYIKPAYAGMMCAAAARISCDIMEKLGAQDRLSAVGAVACGGGMYMLTMYLLSEDMGGLLRGIFPGKAQC